MEKLSVVMIVKNESANIRRSIESVAWADEVVVLDTGSEDDTPEICRSLGCRTFTLDDWHGFGSAKQTAVGYASNYWVLSLDADEVLSPTLQQELRELREKDFQGSAWRLPRKSYYLGKAIRFCGWRQDAPLRLFDRRLGGFNALRVHEGVKTGQPVQRCINWMWHYTYSTRENHMGKLRFYGDISAEMMRDKGKRSSPPDAVLRGIFRFIRMYILQLGILDGWAGWQLCRDSAWGVWYKYHQLWKLTR